MGHAYTKTGTASVYSTTLQPKLCFGDFLWVVEGDTSVPRQFALVDCLRYEDTKHPPFPAGYSDFKLRVIGTSLLKIPVPLKKEDDWFSRLHKRYITKQKFFSRLTGDPEVLAGLQQVSGVEF